MSNKSSIPCPAIGSRKRKRGFPSRRTSEISDGILVAKANTLPSMRNQSLNLCNGINNGENVEEKEIQLNSLHYNSYSTVCQLDTVSALKYEIITASDKRNNPLNDNTKLIRRDSSCLYTNDNSSSIRNEVNHSISPTICVARKKKDKEKDSPSRVTSTVTQFIVGCEKSDITCNHILSSTTSATRRSTDREDYRSIRTSATANDATTSARERITENEAKELISRSSTYNNCNCENECQTPEKPSSTVKDVNEISTTFRQQQTKKYRENYNYRNSYNSKNMSSESTSSQLLVAVDERSESALITESGGEINNYKLLHLNRKIYICNLCRIEYRRKDYYIKHRRRCIALHYHRNKSRRRTIGTSTIMMDQSSNEPIASTSAAAAAASTSFRSMTYHCTQCAVTVDSVTNLRKHRRIHLKRYYCQICNMEFTTQHEHEYHSILCRSKQEALNESNLIKKSTSVIAFHGRVTRARSRAATCYSYARSKNTDYTIYRTNYDDDDSDDIDDIDDDRVSPVDTMFTKRMRFTGQWLERGANNSEQTSYCDTEYLDDLMYNQITTNKEYDLYLLERLKAEMYLNTFKCIEPNCRFKSHDIVKVMMHDYLEHYNFWHRCPKCGCVFPRKTQLDYHLDRQNKGNYLCYKCGVRFSYQHQLDRHLIKHMKSVNYRCNYCNFEFLTETELLNHCFKEKHEPNDERELIRIDPSLTITNELPPSSSSPPSRSVQYVEKILNWNLPKTISKRPFSFNAKYKIGDVLFKDQQNPNCLIHKK